MGGIANGISNIFSGGASNGYGEQQQTLQNALTSAQQNASPYMQFGQQGMTPYSTTLSAMTPYTNGTWMNSYQQSPTAQYLNQYETQDMNNAAAGAGLLGSGQNMNAIGNLAEGISSQDMQNYYNNAMGALGSQGSGYGNQIGIGSGAMNNLNNLQTQIMNGIGNSQANQSMATQQGYNTAGLLGLYGLSNGGFGNLFSGSSGGGGGSGSGGGTGGMLDDALLTSTF